MFYKTHVHGESRIFDHLYDKNYIASDYKDVWKANNMALAKSAPLHIFPVYKTMFTDLTRKTRNVYVLQQNPLPYYPYYSRDDKEKKTCNVFGADRANFFDVALPPKTKPVNLQLDLEEDCKIMPTFNSSKGKIKDIGCQTIYRESSAQTKPWMPNAVMTDRECVTPEIIHVADLIDGDQHPGKFEVEIIERARKRRQWEEKLPPITSIKDWSKRRIPLEAFEWEEWISRENEINDCQMLRLQIVQELMKKRENKMKEISNAKEENTLKRIQIEKQKKLLKIRNQYRRSTRKIEMKHNQITKKYQPTDIVTEHIDKGSDLYGPQLRFGSHPRQNHFQAFSTEFKPRLNDLEKLDPKPAINKFINPKEKLWKPKVEVKEIQRGFWSDPFLKKLYKSLTNFREKKEHRKILPKCLDLIPKSSSSRLTTPSGSELDLNIEKDSQAAIFIQKLIKGRAIQNVLFRGRDKCRDLITELHSTHELSAVNAMYPGQSNQLTQKRQQVMYNQTRIEGLQQAEFQIQEVLSQAEGSSIFYLLDFLSKELIRLHDNRKSHALYMLAEKERYCREAAEAGKRQIEEKRRTEHDEIYRNIINANDETVTLYLENILMEGIEKTSEKDSREKIKEIAKEIDQATCNMMKEKSENDESIVTDLVTQFMIPEVYKRVARRNMLLKQQRHLLAAHEALYESINQIQSVEQNSNNTKQSHIKEISSETFIKKTTLIKDPEAISVFRQVFTSPKHDSNTGSRTSAEETANLMIENLLSEVIERSSSKKN